MDGSLTDDLFRRIESGHADDPDLLRDLLRALHAAVPGPAPEVGVLASTDAALALAGRLLPLWTVRLEGLAGGSHGRWSCLLRETGVRDDDELVGTGQAATPALAILAALLLALSRRGPRGRGG